DEYRFRSRIQVAIAQANLHRLADAAATMAQVEPVMRELKDVPLLWWWTARYYAARGDPAAIHFLELSVNRSAPSTTNIVRLDPAFDKLRGLPEFTAFLARSKPVENPMAMAGEPPHNPEAILRTA